MAGTKEVSSVLRVNGNSSLFKKREQHEVVHGEILDVTRHEDRVPFPRHRREQCVGDCNGFPLARVTVSILTCLHCRINAHPNDGTSIAFTSPATPIFQFRREIFMSGMGDKLKGKGNEVKGKVKQEYGEKTDDPDMAAEGKGDEMKGKAQQIKGKAKDKIEDVKDKVRD
jgi:uncharacterized protein YjbJ (UPF0337 family)